VFIIIIIILGKRLEQIYLQAGVPKGILINAMSQQTGTHACFNK
jgi:hypothetical protein